MKLALFFQVKRFLVMIVLVALLALGGCTLLNPPPPASTTPVATPAPIEPNWTPPQIQSVASLAPDLSTVVGKVEPSVVAINVRITSFNIFNVPVTQEGAGSGWIIDPNGLVVTNNHVVQGATSIDVTLSDGRLFTSQQVVADPVSDLAVVKINASGLPALAIGDSAGMKVGMQVAAIGNALGLGISMTGGYISRLNASITISSINETLYNLIETDAAINPGNSGGPLINTAGQIIGITNAKLVATGVTGIGYAISTQTAIPVIQQLVQKGYVTRPYLGVAFQTVNPSITALYGLAVDTGALITQVASGSPAGNAGLKAGDVIVAINGKTVSTASDAVQILSASQIGQKVTITYWRGSTKYTVDITLIQNPNL